MVDCCFKCIAYTSKGKDTSYAYAVVGDRTNQCPKQLNCSAMGAAPLMQSSSLKPLICVAFEKRQNYFDNISELKQHFKDKYQPEHNIAHDPFLEFIILRLIIGNISYYHDIFQGVS